MPSLRKQWDCSWQNTSTTYYGDEWDTESCWESPGGIRTHDPSFRSVITVRPLGPVNLLM